MLMCLYLMNWFIAMISIYMNHPLAIGASLLAQTILVAMSSGFLFMNFWFSYMLFLIMASGLLVLFIYMTSIASNEKFIIPNKYILMSIFLFITFMFFIIIKMDKYYLSLIFNNYPMFSLLSSKSPSSIMEKFYCSPYMTLTIMLMIYLLFTLVAIVKMIQHSSGSFRQK
uniref:NADH dehydrogenase subunit 6 n=1 Tax=Xyloterini sp. TaxID=2995406 RepID=A0A9E8G3Q6_9CUCU|nr:NADH dehydrogenase subunit 6 [Xyloterini sp.]